MGESGGRAAAARGDAAAAGSSVQTGRALSFPLHRSPFGALYRVSARADHEGNGGFMSREVGSRACGARWGLLGLCWVALALGGCVEDGPSTPSDVEPPDTGPVIVDAETDGDEPEPDVGRDAGPDPEPDGGAPDGGDPDTAVDAAVDMTPAPDEGTPLTIETCEDACDRYAACDRLADEFGDYDACLRDCGRISRDGRPDEWFDCVEFETCNFLRLCPIPDIEPLGCEEACGLVDACEVDLNLPDCVAVCEENGETFRPCAERLFGGQCDNEGFASCVVEQVFPQCNELCDAGVTCNLVRPDACIADCLDDRLSGDPLGALRSTQLASCVRFSANSDPIDCAAADRCFFPPEPGNVRADPVRFCELYEECNLGIFFTCQDTIDDLGDQLACGLAILENGCPFDEFDLIDTCLFGAGPDPRAEPCGRLCEAQDVCGVLPEGQNRIECTQGCVGGGGADPDEQERADASLGCGSTDRCPDLLECIAGSGPAVECAAFCAGLDGCGLADADCAAACEADWPRDRHAAWRTCVAETADDCAAMADCQPSPPPPCEAYCGRLGPDDCFLEEGAGCVGRCDDAHFADGQSALIEVACVLTAPVCFGGEAPPGGGLPHDVNTCLRGAGHGVECLGFCRATTECQGDAEGLAPCLEACGAGLVGDDGLRYLAARDCLSGLPADAACADVEACVPDVADADCAALCDRADGCGLELAECPARCVEDPLARLRALRGEVCITPESDCGEVSACILPPLFDPDAEDLGPPLIDLAAFCVAFDGCENAEFNFGDCEFLYEDLLRGGAEAIACGVEALAICSPFLDEVFDCFGGGGPEPSPIVEPCAVLCEAQRFCDPDAPAQQACERACADRVVAGDRDALLRVVPEMQCGSAWSCPELQACLDASTPAAICAEHCAARDACGLINDPIDCAADCDAAFSRLREVDRRDCYAGIDLADCEALAACEPPTPLPCALACDAFAGCGLGDPACIARCEDAGYENPAETAQVIACTVGAGDDCDAIVACQEDPAQGGGTCFAWCRAVTECDPDADEALPACLTRCLVGFGDGDALRFDAAAECLDAAGAAAECAELLACVPPEPVVDCPRYCDALDACRVPADGCLEACEAAPDAETAACVADALRTGQQCTGVAACADYVPPPADQICRDLCQIQVACDDAIDPFLCRLDCTPTPPAGPFQLACARFAGCGADLDACLALDETPAAACVDICGPAVDACGLYPDADACVAECTGRDAAPQSDEGYLERAAACFDDAIVEGVCDAGAAESCLQPASCELRDDLIFFAGLDGQVVTNTEGLPDAYESPCAGGGAAEQIIVLAVPQAATLTAEIVEGDYDTAMNLRAPCDAEPLACDDDGGDGLLSRISRDVEPGVYYLFIEGFAGSTGEATVDISIVLR